MTTWDIARHFDFSDCGDGPANRKVAFPNGATA